VSDRMPARARQRMVDRPRRFYDAEPQAHIGRFRKRETVKKKYTYKEKGRESGVAPTLSIYLRLLHSV
jgi:hypothetical protein